ncbi:MAG TPA: hypothetical protein PLB91_08295 [Spirochaetales bacterium]|nr:hypothetical protein [Spirochaetales bacterium]HRY55760.1 hypothetical protein [Spirochaetia bacterium]HRZ64390.1 hypothetical protein [Spirochaetia bacterium]
MKDASKRPALALGALVLAAALAAPSLYAQGAAAPQKLELDGARLLGAYCASCHGWAASPAEAIAARMVVPGAPGPSQALAAIEAGRMPPQGERPSAAETAAFRAWIASGAPLEGGAGTADAASGASAAAEAPAAVSGASAARGGFLGFESKTAFHRASGWASTGLFLAAGAVGAVRAYNLMSAGHDYRDELGIDEEDEIGSACSTKIEDLWDDGQALRWTHVGLIVAGESLYLANAITGISWIDPARPPSTKARIHRWAFFTHAALMASEMVLGFLTTDALSRGDHEAVTQLGVAHAAVGFAIPVAIGASGLLMSRSP